MVGERPWSELADERVAPTAAGAAAAREWTGCSITYTRRDVYRYSFRARQLISNGQQTMKRHS